MDEQRKNWNENQQKLRRFLARPEDHQKAVDLFLVQHAMVHSAKEFEMGLYSFEDEIWGGLDDPSARFVPPKFEHSIVWCFWHLTRCEDITMNLLVAGTSQLLLQDGWFERMRVPARDTGNAMDASGIADFSARIDIAALSAYRQAVVRRTREIVKGLRPEDMKRKTDPVRLQQALEAGAVLSSQQWLIDYWAGLTVAGLLLMPPTRHNLVHLNEAAKIKRMINSSRQAKRKK